MGLRFNRCLGPVEALQPKEYTIETASGLIAVCCECGGISDVPPTHEPLKDKHGRYRSDRLRLVWSCPYEPCPIWDHLTLESLMEDE